ncbi:MAG: hypothetical protein RLZ71_467 [Actinomycetota bacterium]|jgi:hypothetical protein
MRPKTLNAVSGSIRLATSLALVTAIVWQITDRLANNNFRPGEYFAYFTIQTSMIAAVALAVAGYRAIRNMPETVVLSRVRLSVVSYAIVVSVVYNALLRGIPMAPTDPDFNYNWPVLPNEILHVWAPIFIVLDFVATRVITNRKTIYWVLIYPLAWLVFSISRGLVDNWWAYWFLNPNDKGGVAQMIEYIFGICAFLLVAAIAALGLNRVLNQTRK